MILWVYISGTANPRKAIFNMLKLSLAYMLLEKNNISN